MKLATLDLTSELFVEFAKACKGQGLSRRFIVKQNPLPDDAEIVRIQLRDPYEPHTLRLYVQSESFAEVEEGATPPELPLVIFETVIDEDTRPDGYCAGNCGINFYEFPDMRHPKDECPGPECTCYEIIGGHQQGCYFYGRKLEAVA